MKISNIIKAPLWKLRQPWADHVRQFEYLDWETQRRLVYQQIDKGGFGYWTVGVAGIGFLTDSYDLFAINTVLPLLELVYWDGAMPQQVRALIGLSVLVGTFVGQLLLGVLGDRFGRRKLYGIELAIVTLSTMLMAIASKGALSGANKVAWISFWRFCMGIGIGGDYPLSAVITSEFAPRKHRGRMLSALFYMQAVGAFFANIITIIAIYVARKHLPMNSSTCGQECKDSLDVVWRWIVGIGAFPPALAVFLRWIIPESPRYTMEVEKDPARAKKDVEEYFRPEEGLLQSPQSRMERATGSTIVAGDSSRRSSNQPALTFGEGLDPMELKDLTLSEPAIPLPEPHRVILRKETFREWTQGFYKYLLTDGNWTDLAGTSLSWLVLDFAYYCLSVNNPKILNKLWGNESNMFVYGALMANGYRALIAVSVGSIVGGALFILLARHRWAIQLYGFWILGGTFVIIGVCFVALIGTRYFAAVIVLYSICSLVFDFGPNTSTYVIAAEVFPTKYRSTCHGISAAAGKVGSIIAQLFLMYAKFGSRGVNDPESTWLGWVLLIFAVWMACGAVVTKFWVPKPVDIWGRSRSLEDLALGKAARKQMEQDDLDTWRALAPGSPRDI
ncbi:MFS general substrate transporter [Microthyrium microscopicum]|uniref:MFS general substrate transporter n=1 Tax=Microthyrium microscopicum TaxID=703497 RepID=A0A6A6TY33_9PEZI|nr:MFS general substrate transporter [Microthyrium microscopicum]